MENQYLRVRGESWEGGEIWDSERWRVADVSWDWEIEIWERMKRKERGVHVYRKQKNERECLCAAVFYLMLTKKIWEKHVEL